MTDIEFIDWLQKWWWLLVTILGVLVAIIRNVIKIHEAAEAIKRVAEHDKRLTAIGEQYAEIKADTKDLKESVDDLGASLKTHISEQKDDMQSINAAVYAILDILRKTGGGIDAEVAHNELRKHMLKK